MLYSRYILLVACCNRIAESTITVFSSQDNILTYTLCALTPLALEMYI